MDFLVDRVEKEKEESKCTRQIKAEHWDWFVPKSFEQESIFVWKSEYFKG